MEVLTARCCGLDVHQSRGGGMCECHRSWTPRDAKHVPLGRRPGKLLLLRQWLVEIGCTHIGMESTGVLWRPVADRLVGSCELVIVNAEHRKRVPGRKTDVQDAEWIADRLATRPPHPELCT